MKTIALILASSILLCSCSTTPTAKTEKPTSTTSADRGESEDDSAGSAEDGGDAQLKVVKNEIESDQQQLTRECRKLLKAKEYDAIDKKINQLCDSRESYPNGRWRVDLLYMEFCDPPGGKKAAAEDWQQLTDAIQEWAKACPNSANARIALAEAYVGFAWKARGGGFADTVSKEGWNLMEQRLKLAAQALKEAEALKSNNPRRWAVTLLVGLGSHMKKENYQAIVNEALSKEPTYETVLCEQINYLLPRWYGAEGEWEKTIAKAADRLPGSEGDKRYARLIWSATSLRVIGNPFEDANADYARAKRGFQILLKEHPNSLAVLSRYCLVAVLGSDKGEAAELFAKLDGRMTKSVWHSKKYFRKCREWAGPALSES